MFSTKITQRFSNYFGVDFEKHTQLARKIITHAGSFIDSNSTL